MGYGSSPVAFGIRVITTVSMLMSVASSAPIKTKQPLVVLAGWLGSERRLLRRYEELYRNAHCEVISHIATPSMVFRSCFPLEPISLPASPAFWTRSSQSSPPSPVPYTMQDLAWNVVNEMHQSESPALIFHAFSNGGLFLWEQVNRILALSEEDSESREPSQQSKRTADEVSNDQSRENIKNVRGRVAGVIFDSCPSRELQLIDKAMVFCKPWDRFMVLLENGASHAFLHHPIYENRAIKRSEDYYNGLKDDPWNLPQLYLYSKNDQFIPHQVIDELIARRKEMVGDDRIWSKLWDESQHCAHLLHYPEEYKNIVVAFLDASLQRRSISRL